MSYVLKWEEIKYDTEQEMLPKRVRLLVMTENSSTGKLNVIDHIVEPLATRTSIWCATDDLRGRYPTLTWKDTGLISLAEQIEAELL